MTSAGEELPGAWVSQMFSSKLPTKGKFYLSVLDSSATVPEQDIYATHD